MPPSHRGKLIILPSNRVWRTYPGGRTLDELAHVTAPADNHFAEDWIASTTRASNPPEAPAAPPGANRTAPPGLSQVQVGHDPAPRDFAALLASDPEYFLGAAHVKKYGAQPQLLVKFLDSGTRLHFQVHPTREFARRMLGAPSGKTEAYYVLGTRGALSAGAAANGEPTGYIYVGFQRPPTPAQLRAAIVAQDIAAIEACFDPIPVRPGDTFIIPGGTPHALGAGVFMVEIQEPSDLVVRFEFERAGYVLPESSRFMNRDVDFALTVFNLAPLSPAGLDARVRCHPRHLRDVGPGSVQDELIGADRTDCFRVLRTRLAGPVVKDETSGVIAIVTAGAVTATVGGESHRFDTYQKFFVPAGIGPVSLTPHGAGAEILECLPPA
ncbi:class I mannose-6-phosphate isomerase [Horticoccus sp. 23ND18S-11]|uniref:class I mannose-6-phosphate isomerase n=1 Tax=Horticoccus sp. 23ND18S-11 TaxID=3391832 RepID=UPI0039C8CD2B